MHINSNDFQEDEDNFVGYKGRARQVCKSNGLLISKLLQLSIYILIRSFVENEIFIQVYKFPPGVNCGGNQYAPDCNSCIKIHGANGCMGKCQPGSHGEGCVWKGEGWSKYYLQLQFLLREPG